MSYAVDADGTLLLIDPLLPERDEEVLDGLDGLAGGEVAILITIPYHARSAEGLARRFGATIYGHPATARRLTGAVPFRPVEPGEPLPGGAVAHAIGRPRRHEMPIHVPARRALAFGDAIVGVDGDLRMWVFERIDERRRVWYQERFAPTVRPLTELGAEAVLVTHGPAVVRDGSAALGRALDRPPWYHAG